MKTLRFRVYGLVQGVWFRGWARQQAHELALAGFVRNLPDGSVDGLVQGPEAVVAEFIERLAYGPPLAAVERVEIFPESFDPAITRFDIRHEDIQAID